LNHILEFSKSRKEEEEEEEDVFLAKSLTQP
jgi:hypothetical protein